MNSERPAPAPEPEPAPAPLPEPALELEYKLVLLPALSQYLPELVPEAVRWAEAHMDEINSYPPGCFLGISPTGIVAHGPDLGVILHAVKELTDYTVVKIPVAGCEMALPGPEGEKPVLCSQPPVARAGHVMLCEGCAERVRSVAPELELEPLG